MPDLRQQLWSVAQNTATAYGLSFAPECQGLVENLINEGATRLETEGYAENPEKIALAESNIALFVTNMVAEAKKRKLAALHEPTFHAIWQLLCPIWPFC